MKCDLVTKLLVYVVEVFRVINTEKNSWKYSFDNVVSWCDSIY
jgi:hypothetical protein